MQLGEIGLRASASSAGNSVTSLQSRGAAREPDVLVYRLHGKKRSPGLLGRSNDGRVACSLAVSEARLALSNFDNIAIRIADVAACLAVFVLWFREELGSPALP